MRRSACRSLLLLVLAGGATACEANRIVEPSLPPPPPPPPANLEVVAFTPVAGKLADRTQVRILGKGFQPGATVTFDGIAAPAFVESDNVILTTAPPHPAGAIDIVVTNPDARTGRLDKPFTYVEGLLDTGDITVGPGHSVTATLSRDDATCAEESIPCRALFIRAPAEDIFEIEIVSLDRRDRIGVYDQRPFYAPSDFPKTLTLKGGQQVWIIGEWALFRLTARPAN